MLRQVPHAFREAARILVLELHARWAFRIALRHLGHALGVEIGRGLLRLLLELLALLALGAVAAARNHDALRAIGVAQPEMQRCEATHRETDHMRLGDA